MRTNSTLIAAALLASCSSITRAGLDKSQILEIVRRDTNQECHAGHHPNYKLVGCDYDAALDADGNWSVLVVADYRDDKGTRAGIMGAHSLHIYSPSGKLLRILPGM